MVDYSRIGPLLNILLCGLLVAKTEALFVGITLLKSAVAKGAVCLDGSPPAYHLDKGFGTGINSWLVHLEGGGWCHNVTACQYCKNTRLGSSKYMENSLPFSGILNNKKRYNPDFYNWNRVKIRYCDGSSFTGDVQQVYPATNLHFRGARIWVAVIKELLSLGMYNAENAFLSGCSAGGLASIMHCDSFKAMLPMGTNVKCLSDGGYFVNVKDISRGPYIQNYFSQIVSLHGSAKNLPLSCTSKMKPALCFFPQNVVPQIRTPLFILNSAYDSWQINNILAPGVADPHGSWKSCKFDYSSCSSVQINTMQEFRKQFLYALLKSANSSSRGIFVDSCYAHCQTELQELWFMPQSPALGKTKVAKAVGDWFYDRSPCKKIDCPYPCNPTCPIHGLSPRNQERQNGSENRNPTAEYTVLLGILWCWLVAVELGIVR